MCRQHVGIQCIRHDWGVCVGLGGGCRQAQGMTPLLLQDVMLLVVLACPSLPTHSRCDAKVQHLCLLMEPVAGGHGVAC